jgi:hypothetical protein
MATRNQTEGAGPSMTTDVRHRPRRRASVGLRRVVALLALVALAVIVTAVPAQAGQSTHLNGLISGPFSGTAALGNDPDCPFGFVSHKDTYGNGGPPPASGTVEVVKCADVRKVPWSETGTFTITTGTGATLFGTMVGTSYPAGGFQHTYTVTGGTRQFRHVRGTISATGVVDRSVGTYSGTYTASLRKG